MLFERLSQKTLRSRAGDYDRVVFFKIKVRIKLLEQGIHTPCFKRQVG